MQIIPRGESWGETLGTGLGELAGLKLAGLVKQHGEKKERSQFVEKFSPLLGKQRATFLSNFTPEEREYALKDLGSQVQLNEPPSSRQEASQLGGLGSLQQMSQQQGEQQPGQNEVQEALQQYFGRPTMGQQQPQYSEQQGEQPQSYMQQQEQGQEYEPELTPERMKLAETLLTTPERRAAKEKMELENRKITSKEDLAAWKNTAKYREKILDEEQSSREALSYIKEAQRLEKEGDFPSQAFASFLKGAEWEDVPGFLSGNAEAFNKVLANFQRGVKDVYGGNVSNLEMEQFLKTIPTLYHTPEGRALIFAGMKKYYRAGKERAKVERQIIKENGGKPMQDLHERVNERFRPIQKELSRAFKRDVEAAQKLSDKTSRLESVLSYGAGKVAGAIPGLIKSAAKAGAAGLGGAAVGSVVPGLGTALGAGIGAGGSALSDLMRLVR